MLKVERSLLTCVINCFHL